MRGRGEKKTDEEKKGEGWRRGEERWGNERRVRTIDKERE